MSSHETRFAICHCILPFLSGSARLALSQVHKMFRVNLASFIKLAHEMMTKPNLDMRFRFATKYGERDLCELLREHASIPPCDYIVTEATIIIRPPDWNFLLKDAAKRGNRDLCEFARSCGATDWEVMGYQAIRKGHDELCFLAIEWAAKIGGRSIIWSWILKGAARIRDQKRSRALCEFARERGRAMKQSLNYRWMLDSAVRAGNRDICILAREWYHAESASIPPGICLNDLFYTACCITNPNRARDMCNLIREWNAEGTEEPVNWSVLFNDATRKNRPDLVELARKWMDETQ